MVRRIALLSSDSDDEEEEEEETETAPAAVSAAAAAHAAAPPAPGLPPPTAAALQAGIQAIIREAADPGSLTVKSIRSALEGKLDVTADWLGGQKAEIEKIIGAEYAALEAEADDDVVVGEIRTLADRDAEARDAAIELNSDSEEAETNTAPPAPPPQWALQAGIRAIIREAADPGSLTVKTIRSALESKLVTAAWLGGQKAEIKEIIGAEYAALEAEADGDVVVGEIRTVADRDAEARDAAIELDAEGETAAADEVGVHGGVPEPRPREVKAAKAVEANTRLDARAVALAGQKPAAAGRARPDARRRLPQSQGPTRSPAAGKKLPRRAVDSSGESESDADSSDDGAEEDAGEAAPSRTGSSSSSEDASSSESESGGGGGRKRRKHAPKTKTKNKLPPAKRRTGVGKTPLAALSKNSGEGVGGGGGGGDRDRDEARFGKMRAKLSMFGLRKVPCITAFPLSFPRSCRCLSAVLSAVLSRDLFAAFPLSFHCLRKVPSAVLSRNLPLPFH